MGPARDSSAGSSFREMRRRDSDQLDDSPPMLDPTIDADPDRMPDVRHRLGQIALDLDVFALVIRPLK